MNLTHPYRIFFAPDNAQTAASEPAAPMSVPEIAMPERPAPEVPDIGSPLLSRTEGPKEAFGRDPSDEIEQMEAKMQNRPVRERDPVTGKFVTKKAEGEKTEEGKDDPAPPTKVAKPAVKAPKPVAKAPEPSAKIKIGDEEKTAEEWAAHVKELRSKGEIPKAPEVAAAKEAPAERKPEEIAAEQAQREQTFLEHASQRYAMKPEELDEILSGGEGAVKATATLLAKVEMNTRQELCNQFNPIIKQLWDRIDPLAKHHQEITDYHYDRDFLEANPDIKSHPAGYSEMRRIDKEMKDGFARINAAVANNTATAQERAWAIIFNDQSPDKYGQDLAYHVREALKKLPIAAASPNAVTPKPPAPPVQKSPQAKPFIGDRPGGGSAVPQTESADARHIRLLHEHGK